MSPETHTHPSPLQRIGGALMSGFAALGRAVLRLTRLAAILVASLALSGGFIAFCVYYYYNQELPRDLSAVADYQPQSLTQVFSEDGELIGEFFLERRTVIPLADMGPTVINAFLAAEDARFFQHAGIDPMGILRALMTNLAAGRVVQGGSTITQQVVKNLLLTPERSLARKIKEAILSFRIESELTKDQILYAYLNMVYLGHGAYGVEAAAQTYFGRAAQELSLAEAAMLAGLVKAPTSSSPYVRFEKARDRQRYVLDQMVKGNFVTAAEAQQAGEEPINIISRPDVNNLAAPYFVEHVRRLVKARYGGSLIYQRGLRIETTLNMDLQRKARLAVRQGLEAMAQRQGYQGPEGYVPFQAWERFRTHTWQEILDQRLLEGRKVPPEPLPGEVYRAVVLSNTGKQVILGLGPEEVELEPADLAIKSPRYKDEEWSYLTVGKVLKPGAIVQVRYLKSADGARLPRASLAGIPAAQGAMVVLEPGTGFVRAMIGGYEFRQSQYNRATQARRQPGSSFKPFVYAAALEAGRTQMTLVQDSPVSFVVAGGRVWSPRNYSNKYYGTVPMRTALMKSANSVAVKLTNELGVDAVVRQARRFGIQSPLVTNLSVSLGSSDVTVLELTSAYAGIISHGKRIEPIAIKRITDWNGRVLEDIAMGPGANLESGRPEGDDDDVSVPEEIPDEKRAMQPANAYVLADMMKAVVEEGTATRLKALGWPAAGKTGTTNGYIDAWFVGFTADLVAGVWVGTDTRNPLGKDETGGRAAAPIWLEFMKEALKDKPVRDFEIPPGVVFARMDPHTAQPATGPGARFVPFTQETIPSILLPRQSNRDPADEL